MKIVGNAKLSAPTSDPAVDFGAAIGRLADEVASNRDAVSRGLPPRFRLEMKDSEGNTPQLVIVDTVRRRRAVLPLDWEKM